MIMIIIIIIKIIMIIIVMIMIIIIVVIRLLLLVVVVVVPNSPLGALWTKCMFFKRNCSRLGQKQLFKSTSMQKHTFLI